MAWKLLAAAVCVALCQFQHSQTEEIGWDACQWVGHSPFCFGQCPVGLSEILRKRANPHYTDVQATFGRDCLTGSKKLCCKNKRISILPVNKPGLGDKPSAYQPPYDDKKPIPVDKPNVPYFPDEPKKPPPPQEPYKPPSFDPLKDAVKDNKPVYDEGQSKLSLDDDYDMGYPGKGGSVDKKPYPGSGPGLKDPKGGLFPGDIQKAEKDIYNPPPYSGPEKPGAEPAVYPPIPGLLPGKNDKLEEDDEYPPLTVPPEKQPAVLPPYPGGGQQQKPAVLPPYPGEGQQQKPAVLPPYPGEGQQQKPAVLPPYFGEGSQPKPEIPKLPPPYPGGEGGINKQPAVPAKPLYSDVVKSPGQAGEWAGGSSYPVYDRESRRRPPVAFPGQGEKLDFGWGDGQRKYPF